MKRSKEGVPLTNIIKKETIRSNVVNSNVCYGLPLSLPVSMPNMASYIICFSTREGVPLFISKCSTAKTLPFPVLGSLNIVHTFTKAQQLILLNSKTKNERIIWREYESVILIAIAPRSLSTDFHLVRLLDTIYKAMTLIVGQQDVVNVKNIEKLKRDLRCCVGVIDRLRTNHFEINGELPLVGDIVQAADCMLCSEAPYLNTVLDSFAQNAFTSYGCLYVNHRIVTATKDWLTLDGSVMAVITFYILSTSKVTCRDIPLFLPNSEAPHRLVVIQLITGVNVCLLCGSTPTLTQLMKEIQRYWRDTYEALKSVLEIEKRCFPSNILLDRNILGFILVNSVERRCLCSIYPHGDCKDDKQMTPVEKIRILRKFYSRTVSRLFIDKLSSESDSCFLNHRLESCSSHQCLETYTCCAAYKLYAKQITSHQIFILFNTKIPTYCLRSAGEKVLETLTKSKHLKF